MKTRRKKMISPICDYDMWWEKKRRWRKEEDKEEEIRIFNDDKGIKKIILVFKNSLLLTLVFETNCLFWRFIQKLNFVLCECCCPWKIRVRPNWTVCYNYVIFKNKEIFFCWLFYCIFKFPIRHSSCSWRWSTEVSGISKMAHL